MMLTGSSSNYLQGDYLEPLPTTLDAKNSPLALLAATCNNIGKDDSAKAIIPPIDRNERKEREQSQSISPGGRTPSYDKKTGGEERKSPLEKAKSELENSRISPRRELNTEHSRKEQNEDRNRSPHSRGLSARSPVRSNSSGLEIKSNTASKISLNCGSLSVEINHKESHGSSSHTKSTSPAASSSSHLPAAASIGHYPAHTGLLSAYYPHLGLPGYPGLPPSGLLSVHKPETGSHTTVTHATVKTLSGATTLVPVCSDPYCVQCKLAVQSARLTPSCPPGCTQCPRDEHRSPAAGALGSSLPHGLSGLHSLAGLHSAGLSSGLYPAHSSLTGHSAASGHVCSWVANGKYCGERFSTSEELMSHLRTHTSTLEPSSLPNINLAAAYPSLAHPSLALSQLYYNPPPPSSVSPTSPLRGSSYGRSLSPNSLLSSRFHPYLKSPLNPIPTSHPVSLSGIVPPPSLGAYPSLYGLPGSRLGALVP